MNKIGLFSVPRSGSSWLGQIFNSHPETIYKFQPNFSYSFEPTLSEFSTKGEIAEFYEALYKTTDKFVNAKISISGKKLEKFEKKNINTLVFKETHHLNIINNLIINSDTKIVGLIRSPFAVINSWINTPKEFKPEWSVKDEWKNGQLKNQAKIYNYFGYNKWKEAVFLFHELQNTHPHQFYLIKYEDLLTNKEKTVKKLFKFCDLKITQQILLFLKQSTSIESKDPYAVYRKKANDQKWKSNLPEYIINEIKDDNKFQKLNEIHHWI